jgi:FkbM family methyltransferase
MSTPGPLYAKVKAAARRILPARVRSYPRLLWAKFADLNFKSRVVRHRYGAHQLTMEVIDTESARTFDRDFDELPDLGFLSQHRLFPGAKVLNIGANQGLLAMLMAKMVAPTGFVWAIEPNIRKANAARRNLQLNGIGNCEVIDAAVAIFDGRTPKNQFRNASVSPSRWEAGGKPVAEVTIDSLAGSLGGPDIITIDVEGFECGVLEGARETLRAHVPDCFVEVHAGVGLEKRGGSLEEILSFFPAGAYRLVVREMRAAGFREVQLTADLPSQHFVLVALARTHLAAGQNATRTDSHAGRRT